jgi:septum formation inhibitor-activating ATPase MinD
MSRFAFCTTIAKSGSSYSNQTNLFNNALSAPARAHFDAARRLKGENIPLIIPRESKGILNKLFGRKAA